MAQTIKILDHQEAIKIAAGEVIERPAHIIKELIENSIDAQATTISIYATDAGKTEISIVDNGTGMSPQDALLCFAHHATSKISNVNDLEHIVTYGFRGEALSSVAAVSRVELVTKTNEEKSATAITMQHGELIDQSMGARETGTTITITDLFAAIPARKKFLKSNDTEWNLIISIFQAFCLRYLNIHFKLFHNGHLSYHCPPVKDLQTRCAQLWTNSIEDHVVTLDSTTNKGITISGAICSPHYHRFNRGQIFNFVNNRWVKNIEITKGIIKGYDGVIPHQKYPAAFVFIHIDPSQIDINVHPKKEEIKFLHPGIVQQLVQDSVRAALSTQKTATSLVKPSPIASLPFQPLPTTDSYFEPMTTQEHKPLDRTLQDLFAPRNKIVFTDPFPSSSKQNVDRAAVRKLPDIEIIKPAFNNASKPIATAIAPNQNMDLYQQDLGTIIGQFNSTYIIIEKEDQLILIDQHSAHERILYERFKKNQHNVATITLLFPHIIKLQGSETATVIAHSALFASHGIILEAFSPTEILITATPISIQAKAAEDIIIMALEWIASEQKINSSHHDNLFEKLHDKILAQKACAAACKAGDILNHEQMMGIIKELAVTPNNFCCPHGRPTAWPLPLKEIEKHFKRDYVGSKSKQEEIMGLF